MSYESIFRCPLLPSCQFQDHDLPTTCLPCTDTKQKSSLSLTPPGIGPSHNKRQTLPSRDSTNTFPTMSCLIQFTVTMRNRKNKTNASTVNRTRAPSNLDIWNPLATMDFTTRPALLIDASDPFPHLLSVLHPLRTLVGGGRWTVYVDGSWMIDDGRWTVDGGRWMVDGGLWMVDCGLWMVDGGWWMVHGTWYMVHGIL